MIIENIIKIDVRKEKEVYKKKIISKDTYVFSINCLVSILYCSYPDKKFMPLTRAQAAAREATTASHNDAGERTPEPLPIYPATRKSTRQRSQSLPRLSNPFMQARENFPAVEGEARVQAANLMVDVFGGLSKQLEGVLKSQEEQQKRWERREVEARERMEALIEGLRSPVVGNAARAPDRTNPTNINRFQAESHAARDQPAQDPTQPRQEHLTNMTEQQLTTKIDEIKSLIEQYVVEIVVVWRWETDDSDASYTWRGVVHENDSMQSGALTVTFPHATVDIPMRGVAYRSIEIVDKIPIDVHTVSGKGEGPAVALEKGDGFALHDVITWGALLKPGKEYDILENRIRLGLKLPLVLSEELQCIWELFHQWVVTTQEKGGLEVAGSNDARMGQMLLDRIRIKHAIAQGADPKYVESHYVAQKDPTDVLGQILTTSINYNRGRGVVSYSRYRGNRSFAASNRPYTPGATQQRRDFAGRGSGAKK